MPDQSTPIDRTFELTLTANEVAGIEALAAGIAVLAQRDIVPSAAVVAALEAGLERLLEQFDLPDPERGRVERALQAMRESWARGNACL